MSLAVARLKIVSKLGCCCLKFAVWVFSAIQILENLWSFVLFRLESGLWSFVALESVWLCVRLVWHNLGVRNCSVWEFDGFRRLLRTMWRNSESVASNLWFLTRSVLFSRFVSSSESFKRVCIAIRGWFPRGGFLGFEMLTRPRVTALLQLSPSHS